MNKKLFLKLGLLLFSLSLVSCSQKNNSAESSTPKLVSNTASSLEENVETTSSSIENTTDNQDDDSDALPNTNQDTEQATTENEYYELIKEAWQKQKDYIDSINDPNVKQSVQTAYSAATFKANELLMEHPEDCEIINASLKRVLENE